MQEIQISQIIRSRRRTVGLEVNQEADLIVRAPKRASLTFIEAVVQKHRNWILRRQAIAQQRRQTTKPKQFIAGEQFLYLGDYYPLHILSSSEIQMSSRDLFAGSIYFNSAFYLTDFQQPEAHKLFTEWYRAMALQKFTERVALYALQMGLNYRKIRLSNAKRLWGSCSIKGNLSFNWRLIMAPKEVIDYVVVHELTHLIHRNHRQKFWQQVASIMPTYQDRLRWLKQQGHQLIL